jgi:hypothetical protein
MNFLKYIRKKGRKNGPRFCECVMELKNGQKTHDGT